jgi:hypothetical protein
VFFASYEEKVVDAPDKPGHDEERGVSDRHHGAKTAKRFFSN